LPGCEGDAGGDRPGRASVGNATSETDDLVVGGSPRPQCRHGDDETDGAERHVALPGEQVREPGCEELQIDRRGTLGDDDSRAEASTRCWDDAVAERTEEVSEGAALLRGRVDLMCRRSAPGTVTLGV